MAEPTTTQLDTSAALAVLEQLDAQLGEVDRDVRAVVALRVADAGTIALTDVTLHGNGVLVAPDDAAGLVVVTGEDLATNDEVLPLKQLLCILPDGREVGVYRLGDDPALHNWSTIDDPNGSMPVVRPRDLTSNTARRAFGLPSVADVPPVTDLLARGWLIGVAGEALARFDQSDGPREVMRDELAEVAARPPLGPAAPADAVPTWDEVHRAAIAGTLELGPFTVDPDHAAWFDPDGLAQLLDRTLPRIDELLGSLEVLGDDDLLAWAIGWLAQRDWYTPG